MTTKAELEQMVKTLEARLEAEQRRPVGHAIDLHKLTKNTE